MRRRRPSPTALGSALGAALTLGIALAVLAAGPALASSYRYWSFWDGGSGGGTWSYATTGPSLARPADGSVQGFRFAVSRDAGAEAARPRAAADFAAVCGATPAAEGTKRVALVIDFGVPADAPAGEGPPQESPRTACAQVAPQATAAEALASVAKPLRYNGAALLCAIAGYPQQGCGEPISSPQDTARAQTPDPGAASAPAAGPDSGTGPSVGLLAGIAAVAALAAAGVWQSRRRAR
ncbi:SCO2322 family protein [Streptomyces sp. NPDC005409]|uniref:SCO2322 family protein n=1 Tax=Streptomyces sp. NPDC005409 TaxID=3155342 RepID=UPI0034561DDF